MGPRTELPGGSSSRRRRLLALLPVAYVCLVVFHTPEAPVFIDFVSLLNPIDGSWVYALNHLVGSEILFGRDVAYTYGPLAYLLHPLPIGSNLAQSVAFSLSMYLLFAAALLLLAWRAAAPGRALLFAAAYAAALAVGLVYENQLLVIAGLLACVLEEPPLDRPAAIAAGLLSAVGLAVKFSLGPTLPAMILAALGAMLLRDRARAVRLAGWFLGAYAVGIAGLVLVWFRSAPGLIRWLLISAELAGGYGVAMSVAGSGHVLVAGVACLAGFLVLTTWHVLRRTPGAVACAAFSIALIVEFRHAFVRQDFQHEKMFFTLLFVAVGTLALRMPGLAGVIPAVSSALLLFGAAPPLPMAAAILKGAPALANARGLLSAAGMQRRMEPLYRDQLADRTRVRELDPACRGQILQAKEYASLDGRCLEQLREAKLASPILRNLAWLQMVVGSPAMPASWVRLVQVAGGTIDWLPYQLVNLAGTGLRWQPHPLLQEFAAYTKSLDRLSHDHFAGERAPDFVVADLYDIDGRLPYLSTPATWMALFRCYAVERQQSQRLLLKRRAAPPAEPRRVLGHRVARLGEWIAVPPADSLLLAALELRLSLRGRVESALLRVPPVFIELVYDTGESRSFRITPSTAAGGLPVNYVPLDPAALAGLFEGRRCQRVVWFRLTGPGLALHSRELALTWIDSGHRLAPSPSR